MLLIFLWCNCCTAVQYARRARSRFELKHKRSWEGHARAGSLGGKTHFLAKQEEYVGDACMYR